MQIPTLVQTIAFSVVHYKVSAQILQIIRILKIWTWAVLSSNCSPELQHLNCIYASIDFVTQKWVKFSIYTLSLTSKRYYTTVNTSEPQLYHSLPEHGSTDNYDGSCWTDSSRSQIQCLLIFSCFFWIIQTDLEATETSRQRAKLPMRELQIMWNEWWNSGSWNERLMWCMFKGGARVPRPLGGLNEPLLPFFFFFFYQGWMCCNVFGKNNQNLFPRSRGIRACQGKKRIFVQHWGESHNFYSHV